MDKRLIQHEFGYWEVSEKPTQDELKKYYSEKYYQQALGSYQHEYSQDELNYFRSKLEQRWHVAQRYLGATTSRRFIDVGCGEGYALSFFRELGWAVRGLDFSSEGVKSKNSNCQDCLVTGDVFALLQDEITAGNSYDIVWLQNVLEHVLNPLELLKSLLSLVSPGGVAVITVPNDCSVTQEHALAQHHIDSSFWVAIPDHLTYFTRESLINAVVKTGWKYNEIIADFPIDWFLFHPGSNYVREKAVGKSAHKARVQLENLIQKQPIEDVVAFWSALAKIGFGRDLTAFIQPNGET